MAAIAFWGWEGWSALVAIGTLGLAFATGCLAWITSSEIGATRRIAGVTVAEHETRDRPIVIATILRFDVPIALQSPSGPYPMLAVELFNAGLGPALEITLGGTYGGNGAADVRQRVLPAVLSNERFHWGIYVDLPPNVSVEKMELGGFEIIGHCKDRQGAVHSVSVTLADDAFVRRD